MWSSSFFDTCDDNNNSNDCFFSVVSIPQQLRYVDLNCRALDGALPEDLTTNKTIKSLVLRARSQQDVTASVLSISWIYFHLSSIIICRHLFGA